MFFKKKNRQASRSRSSQPARRAFRRLGLEDLEGRRMLTAITVTTASDAASHTGVSLRDAIATANSDAQSGTSDTITFDSSLDGQTITLAQGELELSGAAPDTTITIDGGNQITISGADASRVFVVDSGVQATLTDLTITGGDATGANGGGIDNNGALTVSNSTLSNNTATEDHYGGGGDGGGIFNGSGATLTVSNSTLSGNAAGSSGGGIDSYDAAAAVNVSASVFSGNSASGNGGGIDCYLDNGGDGLTLSDSIFSGNSAAAGGGVYNAGTSTVTGATFAQNTAGTGGGIDNESSLTIGSSTFFGNSTTGGDGGGVYSDDDLTIDGSTISGNSAAFGNGGGVCNSTSGTLALSNTIVAGNTTPGSVPDIEGAVVATSNNNLIGDGDGLTGITDGDDNENQVGTSTNPIDPLLAPLAYYGGSTPTMALLAGSTAIDAGTGGQSIGVFQSTSTRFGSQAVNTATDAVSHTGLSLRDAIGQADVDASYGLSDTITFDPSLDGQTIALVQGQLELVQAAGTGAIAIDGGNQVTVSGQSASSVFFVGSSVQATTFTDLTITAGAAEDGGGIDNEGRLTLDGSTVSDSTATNSGGGVYNVGQLTLDGSTVSGSTAANSGGGIYNSGTLTLSDSTIISENLAGQGGGVDNANMLIVGNSTLSGNSTTDFEGYTAASGGNIYNESGASLTICNSTVSEGHAFEVGGGVYNDGTLTVEDSVFSLNSIIDSGGGIYNDRSGNATISNSVFSGDGTTEQADFGGGIFNAGAMIISDSTFSQNTADSSGGGIYNDEGTLTVGGATFCANAATVYDGGGIYNGGGLTVTDSVFSDNTAGQGGGGIATSATLTVSNSTFSGNSAVLRGGGLEIESGTLAISNSTISGNSSAGASSSDGNGGGGIDNGDGAPLLLLNSIVAGNTAANGDPDVESAVVSGSGPNLIGDGSGLGGITNGAYGNQIGTAAVPLAAGLSGLQDNGGPTQTMALEPGSPALGVGGGLTGLSAAITSPTATTIAVDDAAVIASTPGNYPIVIDGEEMLVTNVDLATNTLTVVRGYNGATATTHLASAIVYWATDQRGQPRDDSPDSIGAYEYQTPPFSSVATLPTIESTASFLVTWSGDPGGNDSPITSYTVYVSDNGGAYTAWQTATSAMSATYTGVEGHSYSFYSVATDTAGETQATPTTYQATTTVNTTPPVIAIGGPSVTYNTDAAPIAVAPLATLSTGDGAFAGSSLSITNTNGGDNDRLAIPAAGGLTISGSTLSYGGAAIGTFSGGAATTPLVVTFNASVTQAAILAVVQNVTFSNLFTEPKISNRSVSFQLTDGDGSLDAAVTQTVVLITPPTLAIGGPSVTYNTDGAPIAIAPAATLFTGDGAFAESSLSVANTNGGDDDRLGIQAAGGLTVSGSTLSYGGAAIGTFSGGATTTPLVVAFNASVTQAAILAVVQNVTFYNIVLEPSISNRLVSFQLTDGDGYADATVRQTVVLITPPELAIDGPSVTYNTDGAPIAIAPAATLFTGDGEFPESSLSVTNTNGGDDDRLGIQAAGGLTVSGSTLSYGGAAIGTFSGGATTTPLVVAFNASVTQAAILAVVQNVTFYNIVLEPSISNRLVSFQLTDGDGYADATVRQTVVLITPPTLAIGGPSVTYNTGGAPIAIAPAATLFTGDGAFAGSSLSVTNTNGGDDDRLGIQAAGGLTVSGSTLSYGGAVIGTFSGGATTTPLVVAFNTNATEAAILAVVQNVTFYNIVLEPSISNRLVSFQLTDGDGYADATVRQTVVLITPPELAIDGPSVTYNTDGAPIAIAPAATLFTGDGEFAESSLSVTNTNGGDDDRLGIQAAGGLTVSGSTLSYGGAVIGTFSGGATTTPLVVAFNASATQAAILAVVQNVTFYNIVLEPSISNRLVDFQLTDGGGNLDAAVRQTVVLITPPTLAIGGPSVTFQVGGPAILVRPAATLSTGDGLFAGASLSVTDSQSMSSDVLGVASPGTASTGLFVTGDSLVYNGITVGSFSAPGVTLSVTFNSSATQAAILAIIQNITFVNPNANAALINRTISFQLTDGDGNLGPAVTQTVIFSS